MTKLTPILAVNNVPESSGWYQRVLGLKSVHGGDVFEMLADDSGQLTLCLHIWDEHPTFMRQIEQHENGIILYFVVTHLDLVWKNALSEEAKVEFAPRKNENSGKQEFAIRDLDNYYLLISE